MKQAIVARSDLGMGAGKLAAQVAHASLKAYEGADDDAKRQWTDGGQKKVVLKVADKQSLFEIHEDAGRAGLPRSLIKDAGHTQLDPGTVTAVAVGPASDTKVDAVTGHLSLY
ncbi:MAG: peptidyl-tRNA hydrolase Pth2 [Halobacteriales archaeon]|nr:peptidyl-tRNA hydrolase Pth2 [Halobacteriales archaeon]